MNGSLRLAGVLCAGWLLAGPGFAVSAPAPAASPAGSRLTGELDAAGLQALLKEQKGAVVLLNLWATWCVPCREEFPDLARLARTLSSRGVRVIGVSTDFAGQTAAVEKFLTETKPGFPNYRKKSGGDDQAFIEAVDPHWGGELPFSVLYAADGSRVKVLSGKHNYAEYEREIAKLLAPERAKEAGRSR